MAVGDDLADVATRAGAIRPRTLQATSAASLADGKPYTSAEPSVVRWWTKEFIVPLATSGVLGSLNAWLISGAG
jgi:hypothetical protein